MDSSQYNNLVQDVIRTMMGDREFTLEEALHFEILTEEDVIDILENILTEDDRAYSPYSDEERKKRSMQAAANARGETPQQTSFTPQDLIGNRKGLAGLVGSALKAKASKILSRRTMFHAAKMGVDAPKETIRQQLVGAGLRDKLKAAGLSSKVKVKVDRETGKYHVTDSSGNVHVIEKFVFARKDGKLVLEAKNK